MKILIVDDHAIVRLGLRDLLQAHYPEAQIVDAQEARAATHRLAAEAWDLLLLDINLPGRSGLEVLQDARRLCPHTPVLVLSAYAEEEFAVRALQLGAAGYLCKQGAFEELIAAVRKILAGGRYVTITLAERLASLLGGDIHAAPHEALSGRELQVLQKIAQGRTLKEIAGDLSVSEKTVSTYRARISAKLGLGRKVELTRYALQHKLVE